MKRRKRILHLTLFILIGLASLAFLLYLFFQLGLSSFIFGSPDIPDYAIFFGLCLIIVIPMLLAIVLKGDDDSAD
ncbi:hypothetical protein Enr10x_50510 [Gimesia panareensis]|uniref:Uncharacterized protein n=1 Tax=Gimesia panareensis TaxID=2527978 RepID=A0A517QDI3_9PLAN|nr:hypothetical protein [Gimesia panareensis]QDT29696.1 hypothetical protein Enr10x_50510 [Gimesia panareensis]